MYEWEGKASERLNKLRKIVEKTGFFLGVWTDQGGHRHLVITLNEPYGQPQWAAFMFPWVDTALGEGFLAPATMEKIEVFPLENNWKIALSVPNCLQLFNKAKRKLNGATKFFVINLDIKHPFVEAIGYLKGKKFYRNEIEGLRIEFGPGTMVVITKANPPGPDVAKLRIISKKEERAELLNDWKKVFRLVYEEVIEKVALPNP